MKEIIARATKRHRPDDAEARDEFDRRQNLLETGYDAARRADYRGLAARTVISSSSISGSTFRGRALQRVRYNVREEGSIVSIAGPGGHRFVPIGDDSSFAGATEAPAPSAPARAAAAPPPARAATWDAADILGRLRQHDRNRETEFDRMRCVAASTLSGFIARGPDATATALMRVAAFQRNPRMPNDVFNLVRAPIQRDDLRRLDEAECRALEEIAARVRAGTSTIADLERAQDLVYKAANQVDAQLRRTPREGDLSGLQFTDYFLLQQMVGHEAVPFAPACAALLAATSRPLEAFANALRPGEHAQVQLLDPMHMVGIGRDPQGRLYAYDSARRRPPYGVYSDRDPVDFRRILEEFEARRQPLIPPYVLRMR